MPDQTLNGTTSASATAELQQLLLATEDIRGFLDDLATLTVRVLPGGVVLRDHPAP